MQMGRLIGSATATGTTATITTNGTTSGEPGSAFHHHCWQGPVGGLSGNFAPLSVTVLITAPVLASAAGMLDTSFNGTGSEILHGFGQASITREVLQPDGKLIVVGSATVPGYYTTSMAIARYNRDGSLDSTFGTDVVWSSRPSLPTARLIRQNGVVLQPDGKIVVVGGEIPSPDLEAVRYNANGMLDTTFGTGGKVVTTVDGGWMQATAVALQSDGKIVIGGGGPYGFEVVRLTSSGAFDTTFNGTRGYAVVGGGLGSGASIYGLAITPSGDIVAAGAAAPPNPGGGPTYVNVAVARYTSSGAPDTTFNNVGYATIAIGSGGTSWPPAVRGANPMGRLS